MSIELSTQLQPAPSLPVAPTTTWRQRLVSRLQPHIDAFRQGGGCAIVLDGAFNVRDGLLADRSQPGAGSAANAALVVGILQLCGGMRLAYPPKTEFSSIAGIFTGTAAGFWSSFYLLKKTLPKIDRLAYAARVTIAITMQTGSSLLIGGVTSVITTALAKKAGDLYYDYRARRAHPEASSPLITSDDSDLEEPEVSPDPQSAQPIAG